MSPAIYQPLIAAGGVLALAILAYLTAWVQALTRRMDTHDVQLSQRPGQPPPRAPRATDLVAGAYGPPLAPGAAPAGAPSAGLFAPPVGVQACGDECVALEVRRQHGVPLSAFALRALLGGPDRDALITAEDMVRALALCNVPAAVELVDAVHCAARLQEIAAAAGVAVCLGAWQAPGALHWITVERADGLGCSGQDPALGRRRTWTWAAFRTLYAGELIVSLRPPDPAG